MSKNTMIELLHIDCMKYMKELPDKAFQLAIVDPEWGINAGKKKQYHAGAFTVYKAKDWDLERPSKEYFSELFRVSDHQIIWGANYFVDLLPPAKNWIVWDKMQPEGISFSMHELAFYSGDGQAKIFKGYNGANRCTVKQSAKKYIRIHPTQKPIKLYKWLLHNYAEKGDRILDTHLGSGSSAIAAHQMGFEFVGCEIDKEYFEAAQKRFKEQTAQKQLFQ